MPYMEQRVAMALVVLWMAGSVSLRAQDRDHPLTDSDSTVSSSAPVTMRVDVELVEIDFVAQLRNGRSITGLKQSNLVLFDNGVERPIQRFIREESPVAVALVIDRSGSVAPLMKQIQDAAWQALTQLKKGDAACLVAFADNAELVEPLTTNLQRVADRIGGLQTRGGTSIVDAVHETLLYLERNAPDCAPRWPRCACDCRRPGRAG
jgi:Mg-chelatase subunit ChlD